ncbi:flavohemoglobin expression-modulating QEGLA motif protein [Sphingomonas xanthus]|uniref:Flavohemoglobin expression-modulating QEGLA motif protein n=1 Tax=Sphingomonas xanthus TaxID=2594473 RepID=A0A516IRW6_9SPHN|nr:flavohemoglobin expression-modulating QEGLA motif protein [Sphingomonas xanthus]QDP19648.1 flavohemoglobin expression-modulating QEGLA motif protein [Sphingomonas xanthus]
MSSRPDLRFAPPPFAGKFGRTGALRETVGEAGRVHIDRWLPFLILHRSDDPATSLARRIAVDSSSYLIWSSGDDHAALQALDMVAAALSAHSGKLLVIILEDLPHEPGAEGSAELPPFVARIGAGDKGHVGRAAKLLGCKLSDAAIDLRRCTVERVPFSPLLPQAFDQLMSKIDGIQRLSLQVPQIHRRQDGGVFPAIAHELSTLVGDAILAAACAFLDDGKTPVPIHYRALGRSAYLAAAHKADRKLDRIARSFDFLLSISPINTAKAFDRFVAGGEQAMPKFHYRPLTVDPDLAKRELYAIDLRALEDPLLETLLGEKRREIDAQLTMLATRNSPAFRAASMFLYGAVDAPLLADATAILASTSKDPPRGGTVRAPAIAKAAQALSARYQEGNADFAPDIQLRDDVAGLLVSGDRLMIGSDTVMPAHRVEALLAHEVGVHLLTYFNGSAQGLSIFRTGLAGYEGVQEGLGVFAEWTVGGLTRTRLRLLAGRVVAVDAMLHGADFVEVYRLLHKDHGFSRSGAFGIAARVFRSGGLAKDAIYLQGFRAVMTMVAEGASLQPFWLGKIAVAHAPLIEELLHRGLVQGPRSLPHFLQARGTDERITRLRASGDVTAAMTEG